MAGIPSWLMLGYTGLWGFVGLAAFLIGGTFLIQKFLKFRVPILSGLVTPKIAGIFALVLVGLVVLPFVMPDKAASIGGGLTAPIEGGALVVAPVDSGCVRNPNAATQNVLLATENFDNPADAYVGQGYDLVAADGKTIYNTGRSNTGTTLSYVTITVPHCVSGNIFMTGNSSRKVAFNANQPQIQLVLQGAVTSRVNITPLNYDTGANILANGSAPSTTGQVCPATAAFQCGTDGEDGSLTDAMATNFTIGSGGSSNIKFQMTLPTANSRYGSYDASFAAGEYGVIISAYISDLTAMSAANGVRLNSIDNGAQYTSIPCPASISANRRANVCWGVSTLKSGGTYTVTGTLNCDLGDCAPTDIVDVYINDQQWFKDTDGTYKLGAYDLSGTDVGTGNSVIRYFLN